MKGNAGYNVQVELLRDHEKHLLVRPHGMTRRALGRELFNAEGWAQIERKDEAALLVFVTGVMHETLTFGRVVVAVVPRDVLVAAVSKPAPDRIVIERREVGEEINWLALAKRVMKAIDDQCFAGEIVDHVLRPCGMVLSRHPEVAAWARAQDRKDRAEEGGA